MAIAIMKCSILSVVAVVVICGFGELGLCSEEGVLIRMASSRPKAGGIFDYRGGENSVEIESLARFAVEEHNKKENSLLEFVRVVKAKEQVVAGALYYITLEAINAGKKTLYEAKVVEQAWRNFKQLREFKLACEGHGSSASSGLGLK